MRDLYWRVIYFLLEQEEVETPLRFSLLSRRLEVVGKRENRRARGRRACLHLARPFFLVPTTSKRLLHRLLRLRKMIFQSVKQAARKKNPLSPDRSPIHNLLAPVVQKVESAIHQINHYPRITQLISVILIHWIVIYPVDSAIQLLNNWGLVTSADGLLLSYRGLRGAEAEPFQFSPGAACVPD